MAVFCLLGAYGIFWPSCISEQLPPAAPGTPAMKAPGFGQVLKISPHIPGPHTLSSRRTTCVNKNLPAAEAFLVLGAG